MKFLMATDLHLSTYTQFSTVNEQGMNTRLLEQLRVASDVSKLASEEKVEAIYFLGDILHGLTDSIPKVVYNAAYLVVSQWAEVAPVHIIIGNHDQYRKMTVLSNFDSIPNVHVYEETTQLPNGIDIIPWEGKQSTKKGETLLAHKAINGTFMNPELTKRCEDGEPSGVLEGYKYIYLGHFHSRQPVKVTGTMKATEAMYIGSIMQHNMGEGDTKKGVSIFDNGRSRFVEIQSPRFFNITLDEENNIEELLQVIKNTSNYFKLIVSSPKIELPKFDHRVQVIYAFDPVHEARMEQHEGEDLWGTVERFIEEANTVIDKKEAIRLLREVR